MYRNRGNMQPNYPDYGRAHRVVLKSLLFDMIVGCLIGGYITISGSHLLPFCVLLAMLIGGAFAVWTSALDSDSVLGYAGIILRQCFLIAQVGLSVAVVGTMMNLVLYHLPGHYMNWIAVCVFPIGYSAYYFKKKNQLLFGQLEIAVGVATALGATARQEFRLTQILAVIGAIYIVARGFTNIDDAKKRMKLEKRHQGISGKATLEAP